MLPAFPWFPSLSFVSLSRKCKEEISWLRLNRRLIDHDRHGLSNQLIFFLYHFLERKWIQHWWSTISLFFHAVSKLCLAIRPDRMHERRDETWRPSDYAGSLWASAGQTVSNFSFINARRIKDAHNRIVILPGRKKKRNRKTGTSDLWSVLKEPFFERSFITVFLSFL